MTNTPSDGINARLAAYRRSARRYGRLRERVQGAITRIAQVRMVAFLVAGVGFFVGWWDSQPIYLVPGGIGLVVFWISVYLHRRPYALAPRIEALEFLHLEGVARLTGAWDALPDQGDRFLDDNYPHLAELQLFGRGSIYQLMMRAPLPAGRRRLAELLRDGIEPTELPARQTAAQELARLSRLRHRFEAEGRLVEVDDPSMQDFLTWAERPGTISWLAPLAKISMGLTVVTWISIILAAGFDMSTPWQLMLGIHVVLYGATTRTLTPTYLHLIGREHHRPFTALRRVFALVESQSFKSELLTKRRDALGIQGEKPSVGMLRLEAIVESLAVRHGALVYAVASICLLWEIIQSARLERWRQQHGKRLRADLSALADLEALVSIGGFAWEHPNYAWPTVGHKNDGPVIIAEQAAHPLFDRASRVANDFELSRGGQLVLITGSNMSGKSSFLRTLGINGHLAMAGAPTCAAIFHIERCKLSTSIQITDAPEQGLSRFYAEVKRIAQIIREVEAAEADSSLLPRLYLVDEMLSGTNSRERHRASAHIVRLLTQATRSFGLVTTHDLELVGLTKDVGDSVPCYHFSDHFDGEALHFDYTLSDGVATTTNALQVLMLEGIHVTD